MPHGFWSNKNWPRFGTKPVDSLNLPYVSRNSLYTCGTSVRHSSFIFVKWCHGAGTMSSFFTISLAAWPMWVSAILPRKNPMVWWWSHWYFHSIDIYIYRYSIHIPFIFHSYSIHIPFIFHSYSIHIPFIFHSYSIHIPFIFHSYSIHIPFIFHSYSSHIPVIFQSYSSHIPVIFQSYSSHIPVIFQSYSSHIPVIFQSYSSHIPVIFQSYSIHIPFIFHSYSIHIPFIFHSYSIHIPFIFHSYSIHIPFNNPWLMAGFLWGSQTELNASQASQAFKNADLYPENGSSTVNYPQFW